jgi:hypothetical protein
MSARCEEGGGGRRGEGGGGRRGEGRRGKREEERGKREEERAKRKEGRRGKRGHVRGGIFLSTYWAASKFGMGPGLPAFSIIGMSTSINCWVFCIF